MVIGTNLRTSMWLERLPIPLHHPALLALSPAVGYAIAYFDRLGEALAYGIPPDYISISVTDALSRTILVVVYTALYWSVVGVKNAVLRMAPRWMEGTVRTAGECLSLSVLPLVFGLSISLAFQVLFWGTMTMLISFAYDFFRKKTKKTMSDESYSPASAISQPAPRKRSLLEVSPLFLTVLLITTLVFAFLGGNLRTAIREWYLVSSSNDRMVLLAVYGSERGVVGELGVLKTLTNRRELVAIPGEGQSFEWKIIGPLRWPHGFQVPPELLAMPLPWKVGSVSRLPLTSEQRDGDDY